MKAQVFVRLKGEVLDPEGDAIREALGRLGLAGVASVRAGRMFEIELDTKDPKEAEAALGKAADTLLANPVTEDFEIRLA